MPFSDEMRRALELDARKLEAFGQSAGPELPNGNHTDGPPLCRDCGHLQSSHDSDGCAVGRMCYADDEGMGYEPIPCNCTLSDEDIKLARLTDAVMSGPVIRFKYPATEQENQATKAEYPASPSPVTTERATVYRFGWRRYLSRSGAYQAYARRKLLEDCGCDPFGYDGHDCPPPYICPTHSDPQALAAAVKQLARELSAADYKTKGL